jgi:hypothetical protein
LDRAPHARSTGGFGMTADRPAADPAGCSHPDSRVIRWPRCVSPEDGPYQIFTEECAYCLDVLALEALWESEVVR